MEHIVDVSPFVQILDVPVAQMENQLVEFMMLFDTQSPVEQVIAVPQISQDRTPQRFVYRASSAEGQNSWWKCRLPCLFPLCSSSLPSRSWSFQFLALVVIMEVFKVYPQDHGSLQRAVEADRRHSCWWRSSRFSP